MKNPKITILYHNDNWIGVFLDDKLAQQGHTVNVLELLQTLGFEVEKIYTGDDTPFNTGILISKE